MIISWEKTIQRTFVKSNVESTAVSPKPRPYQQPRECQQPQTAPGATTTEDGYHACGPVKPTQQQIYTSKGQPYPQSLRGRQINVKIPPVVIQFQIHPDNLLYFITRHFLIKNSRNSNHQILVKNKETTPGQMTFS